VEDPVNMDAPYTVSLMGTTSDDIKSEGPTFNYQLLDWLMDNTLVVKKFPKQPTYNGDALNDFSDSRMTRDGGASAG
jgi:hypothetical protein